MDRARTGQCISNALPTGRSRTGAKLRRQLLRWEKELAQAVASGVAPDSEEAQGLVEKHRAALSAFFPVTPAKHFLISRGYVADERFRAHYEAQQEGLAQWLAEAIEHAAKAQGVDTANPEWK